MLLRSIKINSKFPISSFQIRNMSDDGIFSRLKGQATDLVYGNPSQNFKKMASSLVSNEPFTLRTVTGALVEENLNGWRAKVGNLTGNEEVKKLQAFKRISNAMTDKQMIDPSKLSSGAKLNIAKKANAELDQVNNLIGTYNQTRILAAWLRFKVANGEAIPDTLAEMSEEQKFDKRIQYIAAELGGKSASLPYKGKRYSIYLQGMDKGKNVANNNQSKGAPGPLGKKSRYI